MVKMGITLLYLVQDYQLLLPLEVEVEVVVHQEMVMLAVQVVAPTMLVVLQEQELHLQFKATLVAELAMLAEVEEVLAQQVLLLV
jgi:hypothetical protein